MKTWISLALSLILSACGSTSKNENAGQIPAAMECPADQDASQGCPSPSQPAIPLGGTGSTGPIPAKIEAAAKIRSRGQSIEGRCELHVAGEKSARSCAEVKVMVRSTKNGEMRDGVVDGFAVSFSDLHEKSYKFLAQSENFEVTTSGAELKPGRRVLLKVKAKPRKH